MVKNCMSIFGIVLIMVTAVAQGAEDQRELFSPRIRYSPRRHHRQNVIAGHMPEQRFTLQRQVEVESEYIPWDVVRMADALVYESGSDLVVDYDDQNKEQKRVWACTRQRVKALALVAAHHVATGVFNYDGEMTVLDIEQGHHEATLTGHKDSVVSLSTLQPGALVSGSWDKTVGLWDLETQEPVLFLKHGKKVNVVTALPESRVVSGGNDGTMYVWDVKSGKKVEALSGHDTDVSALAVTPDGNLISSSKEECRAFLWDLKTGRWIWQREDCQHAFVLPNNTLVTLDAGRHVRTHNLNDVSDVGEPVLSGVRNIKLLPDGSFVTTTHVDGKLGSILRTYRDTVRGIKKDAHENKNDEGKSS